MTLPAKSTAKTASLSPKPAPSWPTIKRQASARTIMVWVEEVSTQTWGLQIEKGRNQVFSVLLFFCQLWMLPKPLVFRFGLSWGRQGFRVRWFWLIFTWVCRWGGHFPCPFRQRRFGKFRWILKAGPGRISCFACWGWFFSFTHLFPLVFCSVHSRRTVLPRIWLCPGLLDWVSPQELLRLVFAPCFRYSFWKSLGSVNLFLFLNPIFAVCAVWFRLSVSCRFRVFLLWKTLKGVLCSFCCFPSHWRLLC